MPHLMPQPPMRAVLVPVASGGYAGAPPSSAVYAGGSGYVGGAPVAIIPAGGSYVAPGVSYVAPAYAG
uniref:Uncharacterized protein n=1 Tax=Parascaris univalens TaxID=6257 RepID=A0A915BV83_PARUN